MTPLTLREIANSTGGTILAGGDFASVDVVSTDSRAISRGCVFVALHGDTFDGHDHLAEAGAKGASVAIVDREIAQPPSGVALVRVPDTRRALGQLAQTVRRSITRTKVIAIAGSNGKTSTKNALHAVLSQSLHGSASPKSFNNDIGVPATLFPVAVDDDYVILEIGTNHPGEVEHLSKMAEPDIAVITSIGEEHLEFFGNLDGVRRENASIITGLRSNAPLIVTGDDARLAEHLSTHTGPLIRFGFGPGNDLIASDVHVTLAGTTFVVDGKTFALPAIGRHFAANALAVIAIARLMGVSEDAIRAGLAAADASDMRMQKRDIHGITLINDAYNANPTSMQAAIETLAEIDWPGRKIAVLGEMKELGKFSVPAHERIAALLARNTFDTVITIGEAWRGPTSLIQGAAWFADAENHAIASRLHAGDLVLLKGSRSVRLERIAEAIAETPNS